MFCTDFAGAPSRLQVVPVWLNTSRFKNVINAECSVPQNNSAVCSVNSGRCLALLAGLFRLQQPPHWRGWMWPLFRVVAYHRSVQTGLTKPAVC